MKRSIMLAAVLSPLLGAAPASAGQTELVVLITPRLVAPTNDSGSGSTGATVAVRKRNATAGGQ